MSGWGRVFNNARISLADRAAELARIQEQVASGKRIIRASDDPGSAYQILGLRQEVRTSEAYRDNLQTVVVGLDNASSALQQVTVNLTLAKEKLTQAANGTYSDEQRRSIAMEIDGILENTFSLANNRVVDKYLFGGAQVATPPFEATRQSGRIVDVTYRGSHNELLLPVAPGVEYYGSLIGDAVFQVDNRQTPVFHGDTGARPGSGTSSVRGSQWLTFTHTTTQYGGTTGVAPGASSAAEDTILGVGHTLTVDADNQTVWLDNGTPVAYTPLTTDLRVENENGDVVYVDTSGITLVAGQQSVAIQANGRASLDDGVTYADVTTFTDNVMVPRGTTGQVLYVDTTALARTGTEAVYIPGTYDMFGMLINTRDLLLGERELTHQEKSDLLENAMESMEEVMDGVMQKLTAVGSRLQALDMLSEGLETIAANAEVEAAALGDADIAELSIDMAKTQAFYQMTLMSVAKMLSLSLIDFLTR